MAVELIEFTRPSKDDVNLYVTNISPLLDVEEIEMKLQEVFSMFGLIFEIQVFDSSEHTDEIQTTVCSSRSRYAFVKFYSPRSAAHAKENIHGKWFLGGQPLRVQFAQRKKPADEGCSLYMAKCRQLANFYLGFDGWSTSIVQLEAVKGEEGTQSVCPAFLFRCVVRLELKGHDCYCDGVGYGGDRIRLNQEKDPSKKVELIGYAKKLAHRRAFENAFRRVIIISLSNGKVAVEINQMDIPGIEELSETGLVQINQIEEQPCENSQEKPEDEGDPSNEKPEQETAPT